MTASISSFPFSTPPGPSEPVLKTDDSHRPSQDGSNKKITSVATSLLSTSSALSTTLSTRSLGSGSSSTDVLPKIGLQEAASPGTSSASAGRPPKKGTKRKASASGSPPPDTLSDTPSVTVAKRKRTVTQKPKPTTLRAYYLGLSSLDDTAAVVDYIVNKIFERYRKKISESDPKLNKELAMLGVLPNSKKVAHAFEAAIKQVGAAQLLAVLDQAPWRLVGWKINSNNAFFTKPELYTLRKAWECHQLDLSDSDSGAKQYTYASGMSEKITALGVDIFGLFAAKPNIQGLAIDKKIFNRTQKFAWLFGVESDAKQMRNKMGELAGQLATATTTKHELTEEGEKFSKAYAVFTASNNQKSVGFYARWRNPPCILDVRFASQHAPTASSSAASASTASTSASSSAASASTASTSASPTQAAFSIQSGPTSHIGVSKAPATDTDPTHDESAAILLTLRASSSSASASSIDVSATSSGPLQLPKGV